MGLHFTARDPSIPVTVQIRGVTTGLPNGMVFAEKVLAPTEISLSGETRIRFDDPFYAEANTSYAVVLLTNSTRYKVRTATLGKMGRWGIITRQTYMEGDTQQLDEVTDVIWIGFKKLLPITMSHHSYGLVAASKILFAIFPEIVLPVDNAEWKLLFKTVDLSDVIKNMAQEIKKWEKMTGQQLTDCEKIGRPTTLPAIYNVMAMRARPS